MFAFGSYSHCSTIHVYILCVNPGAQIKYKLTLPVTLELQTVSVAEPSVVKLFDTQVKFPHTHTQPPRHDWTSRLELYRKPFFFLCSVPFHCQSNCNRLAAYFIPSEREQGWLQTMKVVRFNPSKPLFPCTTSGIFSGVATKQKQSLAAVFQMLLRLASIFEAYKVIDLYTN